MAAQSFNQLLDSVNPDTSYFQKTLIVLENEEHNQTRLILETTPVAQSLLATMSLASYQHINPLMIKEHLTKFINSRQENIRDIIKKTSTGVINLRNRLKFYRGKESDMNLREIQLLQEATNGAFNLEKLVQKLQVICEKKEKINQDLDSVIKDCVNYKNKIEQTIKQPLKTYGNHTKGINCEMNLLETSNKIIGFLGELIRVVNYMINASIYHLELSINTKKAIYLPPGLFVKLSDNMNSD
jgi:hypothetical protein